MASTFTPTHELDPYQYPPLPTEHHIRILRLQSSQTFDAPIVCELQLINLDKANEVCYEALSYCWGDSSVPFHITCNGRRLKVRENLYHALLRLRRRSEPTWFWIDAISIDQSNLDERSSQVKRMATIFSRAERVLIWLGEDSTRLDGALSLEFFRLGYVAMKDDADDYLLMDPELSLSDRGRKLDNVSRQVFGTRPRRHLWFENGCPPALELFFNRAWFKRRWVVQELFWARHAVALCGGGEVPWDMIAETGRAFFTLVRNYPQISNHTTALKSPIYDSIRNAATSNDKMGAIHASTSNAANAHDKTGTVHAFMRNAAILLTLNPGRSNYHILELVEECTTFEYVDARDRIYGLASLADPRHMTVEPNYRASVDRVYREFAEGCVSSGAIPFMLHCAARRLRARAPNGVDPWPSWIPDWRVTADSLRHSDINICSSYVEPHTLKSCSRLGVVHDHGLLICCRIVGAFTRVRWTSSGYCGNLLPNVIEESFNVRQGSLDLTAEERHLLERSDGMTTIDASGRGVKSGDILVELAGEATRWKFLFRAVPYDTMPTNTQLPSVKLVGLIEFDDYWKNDHAFNSSVCNELANKQVPWRKDQLAEICEIFTRSSLISTTLQQPGLRKSTSRTSRSSVGDSGRPFKLFSTVPIPADPQKEHWLLVV
jgi:hypothetical protein